MALLCEGFVVKAPSGDEKQAIAKLIGDVAVPRKNTIAYRALEVISAVELGQSITCDEIAKATGWASRPSVKIYKELESLAANYGLAASFSEPESSRAASGEGVSVTFIRQSAGQSTGKKAKAPPAKATKKPAEKSAKKDKSAKDKSASSGKKGVRNKKAASSPVGAADSLDGYIRIWLKSFDYKLIDASVRRILESVKRTGSEVRGPIPLPVSKSRTTILISPHKYKDARDQYEIRTHKRVLDILRPTSKTVDALMKLDLSPGVHVRLTQYEGRS